MEAAKDTTSPDTRDNGYMDSSPRYPNAFNIQVQASDEDVPTVAEPNVGALSDASAASGRRQRPSLRPGRATTIPVSPRSLSSRSKVMAARMASRRRRRSRIYVREWMGSMRAMIQMVCSAYSVMAILLTSRQRIGPRKSGKGFSPSGTQMNLGAPRPDGSKINIREERPSVRRRIPHKGMTHQYSRMRDGGGNIHRRIDWQMGRDGAEAEDDRH